jgi:hypothetical protein
MTGAFSTARFVRSQQARVWDQIMNALTATHDAAVQNVWMPQGIMLSG